MSRKADGVALGGSAFGEPREHKADEMSGMINVAGIITKWLNQSQVGPIAALTGL